MTHFFCAKKLREGALSKRARFALFFPFSCCNVFARHSTVQSFLLKWIQQNISLAFCEMFHKKQCGGQSYHVGVRVSDSHSQGVRVGVRAMVQEKSANEEKKGGQYFPRHVVRKKTCFAITPRDVGVSPPDCGGERRVASRVPRLAQQLPIEGGKCTQGSGGKLVICSKTATNCFAHGSNTKSVI